MKQVRAQTKAQDSVRSAEKVNARQFLPEMKLG